MADYIRTHRMSDIAAAAGVAAKAAPAWSSDAPHVVYQYFTEVLHSTILPQTLFVDQPVADLSSFDLPPEPKAAVVVWEDVLFELPGWSQTHLLRNRTVVEVFKRPRWDRMSAYNATALGFRTIVTNVDDWYFDFHKTWQERYLFEVCEQP